MDAKDIKLQLQRLARHCEAARLNKDPVSFLDLANALRIWVGMKNDIDRFLRERKVTPQFPNAVVDRKRSKIIGNVPYLSVPLATGVENPGIQVKDVSVIDKALSPEEIKRLDKLGPPISRVTQLTFSQWLNCEIAERQNEKSGRVGISREALIKRVANTLGGSHPKGLHKEDDKENRFDEAIRKMDTVTVADGYPLTYYQLLEIAGVILEKVGVVVESRSS